MEHNLQGAKRFGIKEYKIRKREIESIEDLDEKINYLKEKAIEYQNTANTEKEKITDDYDAPLREYWSYTAAYRAMQVLMKQITDSNYQSV